MKLDLNVQEVNAIMASLGRMPYESVFALVEKIREQATAQVEQEKENK
jgi:hypothetical protein